MFSKSKPIAILIIIMCIMILLVVTRDYYIQFLYPKKYSEYVLKYANEYNIDENLVYAVIKAESNFNPKAQSNKSAIGLMQLLESTAMDIMKVIKYDNKMKNSINDLLLDAETNINFGTKYLSILIDKYENIEIAVTAYNAGIGTVDNWIENGIIKSDGSDVENIPYKETNNYVRKILRDYRIYSNI